MYSKLNPVKFGLAGGILSGIFMLILTWLAMFTDAGAMYLTNLSDMYPGYKISAFGSLLGLIWGFIQGFISFFLIAWIYNLLKP